MAKAKCESGVQAVWLRQDKIRLPVLRKISMLTRTRNIVAWERQYNA